MVCLYSAPRPRIVPVARATLTQSHMSVPKPMHALQAMQAEMQARMELAKPVKKSKMPAFEPARGEVPPVENRKHMDVQTEAYLEELSDRVIEADMDTQTDAFLDRPSAPIFVPMKTGVDADTQIYEGDLFDFDVEVDPILEVLVGKTLEQSMLEVMEEEELAAMKEHQDHFEQIRNVELAETQRMEEAEKRRFEEKERRVAQEQARVQREAQIRQKVAAHKFTKGYLQDLHTAVFQNLHETGFFYNPLEREVTTEFLPWLVGEVQARVQRVAVGRALADSLIDAAVARQQALLDEAAQLHGAVEEELAAIAQKELEEKLAAIAAAEAAAAEAAAAEAALLAGEPTCDLTPLSLVSLVAAGCSLSCSVPLPRPPSLLTPCLLAPCHCPRLPPRPAQPKERQALRKGRMRLTMRRSRSERAGPSSRCAARQKRDYCA